MNRYVAGLAGQAPDIQIALSRFEGQDKPLWLKPLASLLARLTPARLGDMLHRRVSYWDIEAAEYSLAGYTRVWLVS